MAIIGHKKQLQFLKKSAELGKISHAYLFSGLEKVGKKTVAIEWAKLLMGENFKNNQSGEGLNPDLILVSPEDREIKISQIRDLIWKLSLKPYSAPLKVAIIDNSHLMNIESQNCFLKTLEEPKEKTILILITEYPETLLPTIVSRCQIIKFCPVSEKEIEDYLEKEKINKEKIKDILRFSEGRLGRALDFISNSGKLEDWQKSLNLVKKILNSDLSTRFNYAKGLTQKKDLKEILEIWLGYFRNILISCLSQNTNLRVGIDINKLKNILRKIQYINFLISTTNVNQRLALEMLMLEM